MPNMPVSRPTLSFSAALVACSMLVGAGSASAQTGPMAQPAYGTTQQRAISPYGAPAPAPAAAAAPVPMQEAAPPMAGAEPVPAAAPMPQQHYGAYAPAPVVEAPTYAANGFAFEAMTSNFASGGLSGLLLGFKGPKIIIGANLGFSKTTEVATAGTLTASADTIGLRLGPGIRLSLLRSQDERTELYLHGDLNLIIINTSVSAGSATAQATGAALQLNAGLGVRYWVCPNLAVGYVAMVNYTSEPNQPSDNVQLAVPASLGKLGWYLDGSFVITAAF